MDNERKGSPWIAWCSAIIVLLGLYVGAYVAILDANKPKPTREFVWDAPGLDRMSEDATLDRSLRVFFHPAIMADRKIRPKFWSIWDRNGYLLKTSP